ncbi:RNA-guided endonuclease InsQ/TnpB family protein [Vibrio parahaemolyticus]|uniref:RNA-guided endonuclease InsQ/TnpB family protein n=1 Tax=Vibrio parahaemolyticus TaxID=670 RepID=UPI00221FF94C|nr:transposase [Vibrio parahaemolyticus]UYW19768.1 IS200/IS605 family element transposase accessory protein TnpB [Vibrio parahaemolyticus]
MLRATKIRIYPTIEQAEFLESQFGAVRFAYNKALHIKTHFYKKKSISLSLKKEIKPLLSLGKKSRKYSWLSQFDSISLQQSIINLDKAFSNFFNPKLKAKFPKFKRKHGYQSSYHCTGLKILENAIKIPKCKPINAKIHREISGTLKSITISKSSTGKFYASVLVDCGNEAPIKPKHITKLSGYDLGLTDYLISDKGDKVANPRFLINAYKNLRRKQKALSRCKKGSKNRAKVRLLLAKAHERVANARNDFQHQLSKRIIDENQAIIVETLKSSNMLKNKRLAKHIADAAWGAFVSKLEYKADMYGKWLIKCDQWLPSSKTCSCCGYKMDKMPLHIRVWTCPSCNEVHCRDTNSGKNLRNAGVIELKAAGLTVSA